MAFLYNLMIYTFNNIHFPHRSGFEGQAGTVGLMLAYAVSVAPLLQFFVQQTTEVENYVSFPSIYVTLSVQNHLAYFFFKFQLFSSWIKATITGDKKSVQLSFFIIHLT